MTTCACPSDDTLITIGGLRFCGQCGQEPSPYNLLRYYEHTTPVIIGSIASRKYALNIRDYLRDRAQGGAKYVIQHPSGNPWVEREGA